MSVYEMLKVNQLGVVMAFTCNAMMSYGFNIIGIINDSLEFKNERMRVRVYFSTFKLTSHTLTF